MNVMVVEMILGQKTSNSVQKHGTKFLVFTKLEKL